MWGKWIVIGLAVLAVIILLALFCSVWLLAAAKRLRRQEAEQDMSDILACLPRTDCGQCEGMTCQAFAEQAADAQAFTQCCPYLSETEKQRIALRFTRRASERRSSEQNPAKNGK